MHVLGNSICHPFPRCSGKINFKAQDSNRWNEILHGHDLKVNCKFRMKCWTTELFQVYGLDTNEHQLSHINMKVQTCACNQIALCYFEFKIHIYLVFTILNHYSKLLTLPVTFLCFSALCTHSRECRWEYLKKKSQSHQN